MHLLHCMAALPDQNHAEVAAAALSRTARRWAWRVSAPAVSSGSVWDRLAYCEAHGDWSTHTASGFSGGLQFADATWRSYGGGAYAPKAWQASREAQIAVAEKVLADAGWKAWPACSIKLGLR